jgi:hypothetical protein
MQTECTRDVMQGRIDRRDRQKITRHPWNTNAAKYVAFVSAACLDETTNVVQLCNLFILTASYFPFITIKLDFQ